MDVKELSLSKFKTLLFENDFMMITTLPYVGFKEFLELLLMNKKVREEPVDHDRKELTLIWDLFLTSHWEEFITHNLLARLKHIYAWNNTTIQRIVDKLRQMNRQMEETRGVSQLPLYHIPDTFFYGDEELLYIYAMISLYRVQYEMDTIDLYGRGMYLLDPTKDVSELYQTNIPRFNPFTRIDVIHFPGADQKTVYRFDISFGNSVFEMDATTKETRYAMARRLYRFMQEGKFVIHLRFPNVADDYEHQQEIEDSVRMDNQFSSRNFTFLYTKDPHAIRIERKN